MSGRLSDRIGRRPLLLFFGIGGTLLTVPMMTMMGSTRNPVGAFFLVLAGLVVVAGYTSINAIVKAELFPTKIRAIGVGLPYALTVAIFGGTAELIAQALKSAGHEAVFFWYVAGCAWSPWSSTYSWANPSSRSLPGAGAPTNSGQADPNSSTLRRFRPQGS